MYKRLHSEGYKLIPPFKVHIILEGCIGPENLYIEDVYYTSFVDNFIVIKDEKTFRYYNKDKVISMIIEGKEPEEDNSPKN